MCQLSSMRRRFSRFLNNNNPYFLFLSQELNLKKKKKKKTNCSTYLGVPFSNDLELKTDHTENE